MLMEEKEEIRSQLQVTLDTHEKEKYFLSHRATEYQNQMQEENEKLLRQIQEYERDISRLHLRVKDS